MAVEFRMARRVQFAETDLAGVLHFSNYYRYMEELEHAFLRSIGMSVVIGGPGETISWPRVATSCEYFAPAHFEDELDLQLRLVRIGERSIAYEVEFFKGTERIALAKTTAVCCRMSAGTFRPVTIPDEIRARLTEGAIPAAQTRACSAGGKKREEV